MLFSYKAYVDIDGYIVTKLSISLKTLDAQRNRVNITDIKTWDYKGENLISVLTWMRNTLKPGNERKYAFRNRTISK